MASKTVSPRAHPGTLIFPAAMNFISMRRSLIAALFLLPAAVNAAELVGVASVIDADTLEIHGQSRGWPDCVINVISR